MGRYYGGDIEGKFWFAVQGSYDPAFFHLKGMEAIEREDVWECCGSWCDECDEECPNCTGEDGDEEPSSEKRPSESEVQFNFEFTEEQMEFINKRLELLARACGLSEEELEQVRDWAEGDKEEGLDKIIKLICRQKKEEDSDGEEETVDTKDITEEMEVALKELAELKDAVFHEECDGDSWATMIEAQMARVYLMDKVMPKAPVDTVVKEGMVIGLMASVAKTVKKPAAKVEPVEKPIISQEEVEKKMLRSTLEEARASLYLGLRIEAVMLRDKEKCFIWCEC